MSFRSFSSRQSTVDRDIVMKGAGVHSGAEVSLILRPAEANTGYNFYVQGGGRAPTAEPLGIPPGASPATGSTPAAGARPDSEARAILAKIRRDRDRAAEVMAAWDAAIRRPREAGG